MKVQSQCVMKLYILVLLCGVMPMSAADIPHWVMWQDPHATIEVSFPQRPVKMDFDLPAQEGDIAGHMTMCSAPYNKGVLTLAFLASPLLEDQALESTYFPKMFYSLFVQRLFYHPKAFKNQQTYTYEKTNFEGRPALLFTFSYEAGAVSKQLSGLATLKDHKLYTLFYLAPTEDFKESDWQQFLDSFHFLED